jgi:hypothetical protein
MRLFRPRQVISRKLLPVVAVLPLDIGPSRRPEASIAPNAPTPAARGTNGTLPSDFRLTPIIDMQANIRFRRAIPDSWTVAPEGLPSSPGRPFDCAAILAVLHHAGLCACVVGQLGHEQITQHENCDEDGEENGHGPVGNRSHVLVGTALLPLV